MKPLVTSLLVLALLSTATPPAGALQSPPAPSPATAAQAAPFAGDWTLSVTSPMGPATFGLNVATADGPVRATLMSESQPTANVSNVSLVNGNLVLRYTADYQGQPIPTVVTLTPKGSALGVNMSMMDGQFEMSGTGTKGKPTLTARPAAAAQRGPQSQVARVTDLIQMMAALPDSAPATPKQPRRVLVLAKASGFVHSSIPLAARTIEAIGDKTGAWTTVISYDPAVITAENLQQYDGIFLASTTGTYLDDAASESVDRQPPQGVHGLHPRRQGPRSDPRRHRLVPWRARPGATPPPPPAAGTPLRRWTATRPCGRSTTR